jgi:hypothetical protein
MLMSELRTEKRREDLFLQNVSDVASIVDTADDFKSS